MATRADVWVKIRGGAAGSRDEVTLDGSVDHRRDIIHAEVFLQRQPFVDVSLI